MFPAYSSETGRNRLGGRRGLAEGANCKSACQAFFSVHIKNIFYLPIYQYVDKNFIFFSYSHYKEGNDSVVNCLSYCTFRRPTPAQHHPNPIKSPRDQITLMDQGARILTKTLTAALQKGPPNGGTERGGRRRPGHF